MSNTPIRFHWSLSQAGRLFVGAKERSRQDLVPGLDAHVTFSKAAEKWGFEYLLTAIGFTRPDPLVLAASTGVKTEKAKFMVAHRSGIMSPTTFVQQVNSVSLLTGGRVGLNIVGGHSPAEQTGYGDFLAHDDRYRRTDEFLTICKAFWRGEEKIAFDGEFYRIENGRLNQGFVAPRDHPVEPTRPEIYLGGSSPAAIDVALKHADCLWTLPTTEEKLKERFGSVLNSQTTELGLLAAIIARPKREEAVERANEILHQLPKASTDVHERFRQQSESVTFNSMLDASREDQWLTSTLWTGAVPYLGAPFIAFVGSYQELAETFFSYKKMGISQYLFIGWPDLEEMPHVSEGVIPLVRKLEAEMSAVPV